ncbi:MAG: hypothetical protein NPIRA05_02630 [Nitrospirales bacterium]|nr:MAG: hypothetical protein NPIRA05_02630 [Nitrospirales bacterium]
MNVMNAPSAFIQALHKASVTCRTPDCQGAVTVVDLTHRHDLVKTFSFHCDRCNWKEEIPGALQTDPPWDEAALIEITEEHLLHLEPVCPHDNAPVHFHSLPNPRRKARYQISCHYCGRQAELEWPPAEAKW